MVQKIYTDETRALIIEDGQCHILDRVFGPLTDAKIEPPAMASVTRKGPKSGAAGNTARPAKPGKASQAQKRDAVRRLNAGERAEDLAKEYGVSDASIYLWRKSGQYGDDWVSPEAMDKKAIEIGHAPRNFLCENGHEFAARTDQDVMPCIKKGCAGEARVDL